MLIYILIRKNMTKRINAKNILKVLYWLILSLEKLHLVL